MKALIQSAFLARTIFIVCIALTIQFAIAEPNFPKLTGRVIDNAELLSSEIESRLTSQLAEHERSSGNQIVVVTLPSLQDHAIEEYGYQLGRHWGIGQQENNNGVLLIIAPNERKVRIEVGYGLEGKLTDALSHNIIQKEILPAFRNNNYSTGIEQGVAAILAAIAGEYTAPPPQSSYNKSFDSVIIIGIIAIVLASVFGSVFKKRFASGAIVGGIGGVVAGLIVGSLLIGIILALVVLVFTVGSRSGGGRSGGFGGGSFGGGGFSGGGGSFGGGGASGGW